MKSQSLLAISAIEHADSVLASSLMIFMLLSSPSHSIRGQIFTIDGDRLTNEKIGLVHLGGGVTTATGEFVIALPQELRSGEPVIFEIKGWNVIEPYIGQPGRMLIQPHDTTDQVRVVIARPGSQKVLRSSEYIQHMTIEMEATSAPDHEDEFLSVRANVLGVESAELKTAIAQWSAHAQGPLPTGVAAMYAKKYEEASRTIDQFVPTTDPQAWDRYMALAIAEGLQKKHESEAAIYKQAHGAFPRDPIMLHNAAIMESYKGNSSEAEQLLREALAIEEKTAGPDHRNTGIVSFTLGRTLLWSGRSRDAEPLLRKALAIEEKSGGADSRLAGLILFDLATISHGEKRYPEAETLYRRDLAILEKNLGREYRQVAVVLSYLGATYYDQGKYAEAETTWRRALAIAKATDPNGPMTVSNMKALVAALKKLGKDEEADQLQERLQLLENRQGTEHR